MTEQLTIEYELTSLILRLPLEKHVAILSI